jgi:hypothetical protein
MPKSDESWSGRLRTVTGIERGDHHWLTAEDECFFVGEYTPRAGWKHSTTNQLILNLKIKPEHRGTYRWNHKRAAIADAARAIIGGLRPETRGTATFVPIPPSKMPGDPEYDDRILRLARQISTSDVRELIKAQRSRDAAHGGDARRNLAALRDTLQVDYGLAEPSPTMIILLDDLLTTGRSFRVCKDMLAEAFPGVRIVGLFVARRPLPPVNFDFFEIGE